MELKTRIFILCAGPLIKYNGTIRQLLDVGGEGILERMIRLIREECDDEIFIITNNKILENHVKKLKYNNIIIFHPINEKFALESLYSSKEEWVDKNIFMYGDVVFSKHAIRKILNSDNKIYFFFRVKPHLYLNKRYPEMFSMSIPIAETDKMESIFKKKDFGVAFAFSNIWKEFDLRLGKINFEYFKSYKTRSLISKLCLNEYIRGIFYSIIRPFEGRVIRFIFYRSKLTEKWKNKLIKLFLGKKIPDFNKDLLSSKYIVEIHDITDDLDSPREYKDFIKKIVKKGLLK